MNTIKIDAINEVKIDDNSSSGTNEGQNSTGDESITTAG